MRFMILALSLALSATAAARTAVERSPLAPICARLCGGEWRQVASPEIDDQIVSRYSFAWDEEAGLIRGERINTGGVGGIHERTIILIGTAAGDTGFWILFAWKDGTPTYGTLTGDETGIQFAVQPIGTTDSRMITALVFDGPDAFTQTAEIAQANGTHTIGAPVAYTRAAP